MNLWRTMGTGAWLTAALLLGDAAQAARIPVAPTLITSEKLPFTATASPAVADLDGDGRPEVAMSVDHIGYAQPTAYEPLFDPANPNEVGVWSWGDGTLQLKPGWPRKTRDATLGLALMDLTGDGLAEVLGMCSQDNYPPAGFSTFVSRLYVWDGGGSPVAPWAPWSILPPNPAYGNTAGVAAGHSYAPPVGLSVDGSLRIFQASQGVWGYWDGSGGPYYPRFGSLAAWSVDGTLAGRTSTSGPSWKVLEDSPFSRFSLDIPPVVVRRSGGFDVAVATNDGLLYRWTSEGASVGGWYPDAGAETRTDALPNGVRATVRSPIAAADLTGDGNDEIVAASGDLNTPNSGAVTCWSPAGQMLWRYPVLGTTSAFTSGIAAGTIGGKKTRSLAVGDANGVLTVLNARGGVVWKYNTAPGAPAGRYPMVAEPVIGDVNADGAQDVVVGGTSGFVYALDGRNGALLWKVPTPIVATPFGLLPEAVIGTPAFCDLQNDGRLDVVVVTWQRYYRDRWYGFGHLLVWECGPGTYNAADLDWPQYRRNAMRTGRAAAP